MDQQDQCLRLGIPDLSGSHHPVRLLQRDPERFQILIRVQILGAVVKTRRQIQMQYFACVAG